MVRLYVNFFKPHEIAFTTSKKVLVTNETLAWKILAESGKMFGIALPLTSKRTSSIMNRKNLLLCQYLECHVISV